MRLLLLALFVCLACCQYDGGPSMPSHSEGYATPEKAKQKYEGTQNKGGPSPRVSKSLRRLFKMIEQKMNCGGDSVSSPDDQYFMQNYQEIKKGFTQKVQQAPPQVQSDFAGTLTSIGHLMGTFSSFFHIMLTAYQGFTGIFQGLGISYDPGAGGEVPDWEQRLNAAIASQGDNNFPAPPAPTHSGSGATEAGSGPAGPAIAADAPRNKPGLDIPPPPSEEDVQPVANPPSYGKNLPAAPKPSPMPYKPYQPAPSHPSYGQKPSSPKPSYMKPKPNKPGPSKPSYGQNPPAAPKPSPMPAKPNYGQTGSKPSYAKSTPYNPKPSKPSYGQSPAPAPKPSPIPAKPSYVKPKPYKPSPPKPTYVQKPQPYNPKPSKPNYVPKEQKPYKPRPNKPEPGAGPKKAYKPKPVKKPDGYAMPPKTYPPKSSPAKTYPATQNEDTPYDVPEPAAADAPKKKASPKKKAAPKKPAAKGKVTAAKQKQNVNVKGGKVYTVVKAPRYIDLYVPAAYSPEQTAAAYAAAMAAAQKDAPENPMILPPPPPGVQMTVRGGEDLQETGTDDQSDPTQEQEGPAPPPSEGQDSTGYRRY